jgi:hypothetical protein
MSIGDIKYIHNLFSSTISDMAVGTGSISKRLASAYSNYLYKIEWEQDIALVPNQAKEDFETLAKLLTKNIKKTREQILNELLPNESKNEQITRFVGDKYVISKLHWKTAQKMATKIQSVHFWLCLQIEQNYQFRPNHSNSTPSENQETS